MPTTAPETNPDAIKRFQCRHIFTDGRRCASPCLRHEEFCYYHHTTRTPVAKPKARRSRRSTFHLPQPEDRSAIQSSIGEVLRRIAGNEIDSKRAGLLLYGLQIASINLPRAASPSRSNRSRRYDEDIPEITLVEEIVIDPTLGPLAPRAEVFEEQERLSVVGELLRDLVKGKKSEDDDEPEAPRPFTTQEPPRNLYTQAEASAEATILPSLQATTSTPEKKHHLHQHHAASSHDTAHRPLPSPVPNRRHPFKSVLSFHPPQATAHPAPPSTLVILTMHAQTNCPHHPRRLGLSPRDPR